MNPVDLPLASGAHSSAAPAVPDAHKQQVEHAAKEFEAIFLRKILSSLEKAGHMTPSESGSGSTSVYSSMMVAALADAMVSAGGIGLAHFVSESLSGQHPQAAPAGNIKPLRQGLPLAPTPGEHNEKR
jgi:Rod binding domain-containing protein